MVALLIHFLICGIMRHKGAAGNQGVILHAPNYVLIAWSLRATLSLQIIN